MPIRMDTPSLADGRIGVGEITSDGIDGEDVGKSDSGRAIDLDSEDDATPITDLEEIDEGIVEVD